MVAGHIKKLFVHTFSTLHLVALVGLSSCGSGPRQSLPASPGPEEPHRPAFHFTPDSMWMNDPNGMVHYRGEYHLFYQHHPHRNVWGPMHWGHAVSRDLVRWEHLPVALHPDRLGTIFSGSAVVDRHNTSGLGSADHPPLVAIFTHHNDSLAQRGSDQYQYQSMAYSTDGGRSWIKYDRNPVLENPGIPDFRDPKVIWYEAENRWIMTLAAGDRIQFYSSENLTRWNFESEFGENSGAHGGVWECPDLFPLEVDGREKWILLVSINPGGPNGGSATQYFIGEFDGHRFRMDEPGETVHRDATGPRWLDYGKDNYAGVTWSDIPAEDGRRIFIGWMSNWQYANQVPTKRWRSAMTVPRTLELRSYNNQLFLASYPVSELATIRRDSVTLEKRWLGENDPLPLPDHFPPSRYELDLTFRLPPGEQDKEYLSVGLANSLDQQMEIRFTPSENQVAIDRTRSGKDRFSEEFAGIQVAPFTFPEDGVLKVLLLVDRSSMELFVDEGRLVMTSIFFPGEDYHRLSLQSRGEAELTSGTVYSLASTR